MAMQFMTKAQDFALMNHMTANYSSFKGTVSEYTEAAKKELGFEFNKDHVYYRARQLGLENPQGERKSTPKIAPIVLVLEEFLAQLGPLAFVNRLEDIFKVQIKVDKKASLLEALVKELE